jgi:hypothetical protein
MLVTYSFYSKKKRKFITIKPTTFYLNYYFCKYNIITSLYSQKLPKLKRELLVKLL